jgi:septal ring factor EnvC (AmiA/AmiB activator)
MRPAIHSTEEPPSRITDLELKEYVNELRRRIEVQNDQMEILADQLKSAKKKIVDLEDMIERLTIDLSMVDRSNKG